MPWNPAHESHAIERVSITLQFAEPIGLRPWQTILNNATLKIPTLGSNVTVDEVGITLPQQMMGHPGSPSTPMPLLFNGNPFGPATQPPQAPTGRTFQWLSDQKVIEQASVRRAQFFYMTPNYQSWSALLERMESIFSGITNEVLKLNILSIAKIEYWDKFLFTGKPHSTMYEGFLEPVAKHLPKFCLATGELWHSHIGYIVERDRASKRLVNLNVDMVDLVGEAVSNISKEPTAPPPVRAAAIYTMVQDTFSQAETPSVWSDVSRLLSELHDLDKGVLSDILTSVMARRIGLID